MKIGVNMGVTESLGDIGALAKKAEDLGFESLWFPEHVIVPVNYTTKYGGTADGSVPERMRHMADPLIALTLAVPTTTNLKLGTSICLVPEHNPLALAKQIATLDLWSGGRFLFGIGAGWFKEETEIMGGNFEHRWTESREIVEAMKELWTKDEASYHGQYVNFPPVYCYPKPAQKPHPPVILGGTAKNVHRRVVQWGDGWMPNNPGPEVVKQGRATLDELADSAGRDPASIEVTVFGTPPDADLIRRYEDAGAERVVVRIEASEEAAISRELEESAEKVLA